MATLGNFGYAGTATVYMNNTSISGPITGVTQTANTFDYGPYGNLKYASVPSVYTYTVEFMADPNAVGINWYPIPKENDMDVIDALFELKPKLKKKYKGSREDFRKDLLAAAEAKKASNALGKLGDLLAIEQ